MKLLFNRVLKQVKGFPLGKIGIKTPENKTIQFEGELPGPSSQIEIKNWKALSSFLLRGELGVGESYTEGHWDTSDLPSFLNYASLNLLHVEGQAFPNPLTNFMLHCYNTFIRMNTRWGSRKNIRKHYDISNDFYRLWLDPTMTYSSALRNSGKETLFEAQKNKYQRIIKTLPMKGADVLEIGCGWGGFLEEAANAGANITGITISENQYAFAKERLQNKAQILMQDYRDNQKKYDFIVSIEMFEAVGEKYWPIFFQTVKKRLVKGGKALIQTITIRDDLFEKYRKGMDYLRLHIFPGGIVASKKRFCEEANRAGLEIGNIFEFGDDYGWTLRQWLKNFNQIEPLLLSQGYPPKFLRSWNYYLAFCTAGFESKRTNVMQIELLNR